MNFERFSKEQLQEARLYASSINRDIAREAAKPDFGFADHVSDAEKNAYINNQLSLADDIDNGKMDGNFTVRQRMYYFLTGECVPILK
jgi:hypothetical protein